MANSSARSARSALAHHSADLLGDLSFVGHLADGKQLEVQAVVEGHISRRGEGAGEVDFLADFLIFQGENREKPTKKQQNNIKKWVSNSEMERSSAVEVNK